MIKERKQDIFGVHTQQSLEMLYVDQFWSVNKQKAFIKIFFLNF